MEQGLVDRTIHLVEALRAAGIPVSLAESIDAVQALGTVDLLERESLRQGLAATTVKRAAHRPAFDTLFDLWFPAMLGEGVAAETALVDAGGDDATEAQVREALRERLREALLAGDDDALRRVAQQAVSALGTADGPQGRLSYFSYRVLRALSPETLMAGLLQAMLTDTERGGLAEQVARRAVSDRTRAFEGYVEAEVRRRLAEEKGPEKIAKTAVRTLPEDVDFVRATAADLAELRRTVGPLARRLATRLAARRRRGNRGRLDFRRTVRASLSTGGVPVVTHHRPPRPHKPELVVLCDVSGSVSAFAKFTLMLAYALREQFSKVRMFAFVDTTDEVTAMFAGGDFGESVQRMTEQAQVVWFDGHSDYGHAFEVFAERWPDAVGPRTSLLVLGDARNNYRASGAGTLRMLSRRARHAYWLNPEPRAYWCSGDSAVNDYEPVVDEMVECRTAAQLSEFVTRLLPV
jgi:uncharacterized protein with von Willebrand factor type A (vWA) domain